MRHATTHATLRDGPPPVLAPSYVHAGLRCRWSVTPQHDGWLYEHACTREALPRHLRAVLSYEAGRAHGYGPSSDLHALHLGPTLVQRGEYLAALCESLVCDLPLSPLVRVLSIDDDRGTL